MGVQGLWELLAPVGRRVSVETLAGKKLAIDASIWMIQFMKAMRDERGEMVRNAHLLGFFRRICKLLFLRTKPVFVFDGGTPALKRRTVAARRRHRDNARAKIRKTAEKLLLNHLKSKRLEELAEEVKRCKSGANVDLKGKQVASSGDNDAGILKESRDVVDRTITRESLDQMLAASIAAEEEGKLIGSDLMPSADVSYEEEGGVDEDEEMIFHVNGGTIDPSVLASLPPSMQLDLLDQMRERLMAENRQKYQKFKKMPAKFSELQIQSYLKTVAFRREIDEVHKCAAGKGVGGIQTSRIASEANREYIFSSSFTGDKQMLTSTGVAKGDSVVNQEMEKTTALDTAKGKLFVSPSKPPDFSTGRTSTEFAPDVETYLDDRGRVRVSRVRGLGIRLTRDLQRNLDLMKEYEQLLGKKDSSKNPEIVFHSEASDFSKDYSANTNCIPSPCIVNNENNSCTNASIADDGTSENMKNSLKSTNGSVSKAAIEICFTEDEIVTKNLVDNFFFNLVSGDPTSEFFPGSTYFEKNGDHSESECIWEDGMVGEQNISVGVDYCEKPLFDHSRVSEDDEVEWEEGDVHAPHSVENEKSVSRGLLEEEANLQEAIRRSLEEIKVKHSSSVSHVEESTVAPKEQSSLLPVKTNMDRELTLERMDGAAECSRSNDRLIASDKQHFPSSFVLDVRRDGNAICTDVIISTVSRSDTGLLDELQPMEQSKNECIENLCKVGSNLVADAPKSTKTADHVVENGLYIDLETANNRMGTSLGDCNNDSADSQSTGFLETGPSISFSSEARSATDVSLSLIDKTEARIDAGQGLAKNDNYNNPSNGLAFRGQTLMEEEDRLEKAEVNFDDEIAFLERERTNLGEEKRKLERNAESVSSEMFAECQELLQMFGLPYIIAPMEAEAQCAYMEMIHLVDGVVTDDSDVFLFGARNVYKNIFDDRKYVETYFMKDIESELGLSRDKLIRMALLLGSDYTEGVSGIGIVNAIEVVNAYPEEDGLVKFREWVESPDPAILGVNGSDSGQKLNVVASKGSSKSADGIESNMGDAGSRSPGTTVSDAKKVFMDKHRNVSKNWHFPPSFPSALVNTAYNSPQIDGSSKSFAWGMPDLPLLREMCWEKFGWPNQKSDQLLVPVLKEYNKHETQLRLEAFYSFNERFAKVRSQRIKKAIKGITGKCSSELTVKGSPSSRRKQRITSFPDEQSHVEKVTSCSTTVDLKSSKQINGSAESSKQVGGSAKSRSSVNARAIGRGRGRGQPKGKISEQSNVEKPELNGDDESGTTSEMLKSTNLELRRSTRHRKQVSYVEDGCKINKHCNSDQAGNKPGFDQEAATKTMPPCFDGDKLYEEDTILEDHLQFGDGFCLEEKESHKCQGKEPMIHLVNGGGFCLDEEDSGPSEWSEAKSHVNGGSFNGCKEMLHEELRVSEKGSLGTKRAGETGAVPFSLTPMPSLKRKRRKG